ncbi:MAG: right-handed parallel beta-helix repeat-containing protein, partial [Thermomicrobiales bacterium]
YGVHIAGGATSGAHDLGNGNTIEDAEIFGNSRGVQVQGNVTNTRMSRLHIHHNNVWDAIKLETYPLDTRITDTVVEYSHLHDNRNGIFEAGGAERTWIHDNEINNNGASKFEHGLYLKGFEGLIQDNKIHHNSGHGIHLWAAPRGSDARHYIVERNDVYANGISQTYPNQQCTTSPRSTSYQGAGISVGGTPGEFYPPGDGLPRNVEVRYNSVHHNIGPGLYYLVDSCTRTDDGNVFHHNTVYDNVDSQLILVGAAGTKVRIKNNVLSAKTGLLVLTSQTNLAPNALNGNLYEQPGAGAATALFSWNWLPYSFNQLRSTGVLQDQLCGTTSAGDPSAIVDWLSRWSTEVRLVDRSMALWNEPAPTHNGDPHLRVGSDARSGGICCPESNGGTDIDGETVYSCATQGCQVDAAAGVGADFQLDSDGDGTADRYDCAPANSTDASLCDGDADPDPNEEVCAVDYPGAPYDRSVFDGQLTEICDGKDDDCDGQALEEHDDDADGFFDACGGDC